ncbi:MAG TPA: DMT family transporter [Candidatus Krumholzibacteria bacterium]|nr:DMT family transporter [Candidatus Krumholzibacteria bacterium]
MAPPAHASSRDDVPRALAWMAASGLSFALMGASVKLAGDLPVALKVCVRNLVTLGLTTLVMVRTRQNPFARTPHWPLLLGRALCGLLGVWFYFVALGSLTLADASLLNKTSPFFATLLAVVLLREPLVRGMRPALLVAFLGAVLVIKPAFDYSPLPALAGIASGLFAGAAYAAVRSLKGRSDPNRIIFTFSLVSTLATLPFALLQRPDPTAGQWWALAGTGVFAAGGQYGLTFAYHHARVNKVAVFSYLHVLFALAVGFAVWGERPDLLSLVGGGLILAAAALAHRAGTRADVRTNRDTA